jgi:hypothetical protein
MSTSTTEIARRPVYKQRGLFGRRVVDLNASKVVKFFPALPPDFGEIVLVDGVRCQVSWIRVKWDKEQVDGTRKWTIKRLVVKSKPG